MVKRLPPLPIQEEPPKQRRLAWWIENTLVRTIKRGINETADTLRKILSFSITDFVEDFEHDLIELIRPFADMVLSYPSVPGFVKTPLQRAMTGEKQAGLALLAILVGALGMALSSGIAEPVGKIIAAGVNSVLKPTLVDPGTLVALWRRNLLSEDRLTTLLNYHGYDSQAQEALKKLSSRLIGEQTLTTAYWRKTLDSGEITKQLESRGFTRTEIGLWFDERKVIPSPQELISMAVREAFNDTIARQFGYDEGYPAEAAEWAKKQGMDEIWFKRAWRAHWTLPGLVQVREMRNRGIINDSDVDSFLVAADIPIFWRTALKKYMYSEVTRVDLRRMYELGVITIQEVYQRYIKIGYTPDDAAKLTEWTAKEYLDTERELTKSDILAMYQSGLLSESEAMEYLGALEYQPEDIALLLAHRDLKRQEEYESKVISNTRKLFLKGVYDRTNVFAILGKLDTPGGFIEETLIVWDLEKQAQIAIPTVTQYRDMVLAGVITREDFRTELTNKGYEQKSIDRYTRLWFEGTEK